MATSSVHAAANCTVEFKSWQKRGAPLTRTCTQDPSGQCGAKSGPKVVPYSAQRRRPHRSRKAESTTRSESNGNLDTASKKAPASARFRAGGYSLSLAVRKLPWESVPILTEVGGVFQSELMGTLDGAEYCGDWHKVGQLVLKIPNQTGPERSHSGRLPAALQ